MLSFIGAENWPHFTIGAASLQIGALAPDDVSDQAYQANNNPNADTDNG